MYFSNSIIFVVKICVFELTKAGEVPLYYRTREVNNELLESYFKLVDPSITDKATLLSQYAKTVHVGFQTRLDCAFKCNLDNDCNFLVYNETEAKCNTYKLDGIAVVDNGLYQNFLFKVFFTLRLNARISLASYVLRKIFLLQ